MKLNIHQTRMQQAILTSKRSSCVSRQVGSIIIVDDRIVSEGYNGTPKGYVNCCDHFSEYSSEHHEWSKIHEIHAEQNAIIWAARKGIAINGGIIYTTTKPCSECTKMIIASGIKEIYYNEEYSRNDDETLNAFLEESGVGIYKVEL